MKSRTLVANKVYFGLEPLLLQRGAERVLARVDALPPGTARVNAQTLREDFELDTPATLALLHALVSHRMLHSQDGRPGEYIPTVRFREFAQARVVPPLQRAEAKALLDEACRSAARMNAAGTRNPLLIDMIAVSGPYMGRSNRIAELKLWPVVRPRVQMRASRFASSMSESEAAKEIRITLRAQNPFIRVYVVADVASIERPFCVPFRAEDHGLADSPQAARLRVWGNSIRRQLIGR